MPSGPLPPTGSMQVETLPLTQLQPAPYNPRVHLKPGDPGWDRLRRSLQEFDLVQPIVWNRRTGHVVSGHQRVEILKYDGAQAVNCVVVDLPLEREQALNIALNNNAIGGDWDDGKLVDLLTELHDLPEFDATLTGFDDEQLQDLLFRPDPEFPREAEPVQSESAVVTVILETPSERWAAVQEQLNQLLTSEPTVRLHVKTAIGDPHPAKAAGKRNRPGRQRRPGR